MKLLITLLSIFISCIAAREWLSNANFYQIYPRSFMDSNGDGVGDLQGIKSKAAYLKSLGMDGVWLSPIMASPMKDHGYDISDFKAIHHEFGTMEDFDQLLAEFKKQGLKLILDFVPNHSSSEHDWFIRSENKEPGYEDYYIWHPGKPNPNGGRPLVPNNWLSAFRGSAWQWSEKRKEYYYHVFVKEQPDLNYRNPKVVEEMKNVLRFWLEKGVSGFRCDTVPHLFEVLPDADGNLPDEPLTNDPNCDPEAYCYLDHTLTQVLPETYDMIYQWREVLEEFHAIEPRVLMTEAYTSLPKIMEFYTDGRGRNGSHIPFNFELLSNINRYSSARNIKMIAENYMNNIPEGYEPNWVLGNHDQHRISSRLGEDRAELYNILLQTLPGNAVTYQGEEIIMPNVLIPWEKTQDPQACATNETIYHQNSRDPARTPMQWDDSKNAGFSTGDPWLPVGDNYRTVNVKAQEAATNSPLKIFRKLVELHKSPAFREGFYESSRNTDANTFAYLRGDYDDTYVVILNYNTQPTRLNLLRSFRGITNQVEVITATTKAGVQFGQRLQSAAVDVPANSGIVVKVLASSGAGAESTVSDEPSTESSTTVTGAIMTTPKASNSNAISATVTLIFAVLFTIMTL